MKTNLLLLITISVFSSIACVSNSDKENISNENKIVTQNNSSEVKGKNFKGAFSNGMKGDSIFFTVSADGKKLSNLTFKGYWRCSGKLEQTRTGPDGNFEIINGKAQGHISEPPNGGSTAWRFDIDATITGNKSSGTFRMNINNLGCDTYLLKFTAVAP